MPILNGIGSFAILYLFKCLGDLMFKKESLGGGDIKLLFFIGLTLGFDMSIVTIFMASFIALPLSVISLIKIIITYYLLDHICLSLRLLSYC